MKKIISIILAIILSVLSLECVSFAVGKGKIEAESKECKPGETVEVAINISGNPGIIAAKFSIEYDKTKLKLIDAENGNVFRKSASTFSKSVNDTPYTMFWEEALSKKNITENGTLAVLKFEVIAKESCETFVKVKLDRDSTFDVNLNNVNFDVSDAKIEIKSEQKQKNFFEKTKEFFKKIVDFISNLFK